MNQAFWEVAKPLCLYVVVGRMSRMKYCLPIVGQRFAKPQPKFNGQPHSWKNPWVASFPLRGARVEGVEAPTAVGSSDGCSYSWGSTFSWGHRAMVTMVVPQVIGDLHTDQHKEGWPHATLHNQLLFISIEHHLWLAALAKH